MDFDQDDLFGGFGGPAGEETLDVSMLKGVKRESSPPPVPAPKKAKAEPVANGAPADAPAPVKAEPAEAKPKKPSPFEKDGRPMRHDVAYPDDYDYIPLEEHVPADPPARTYKFEIDPFQRAAIYAIERSESVLVAAHTSAGKTVVAEYAIAQSLKNHQRVIYTSPIKALSNQKYREFTEEFEDVGLMTGDVTINPSASCLVMTTEILRSMLYRGSEILREISWVIFDEVHYMRDKERGVVWEETLILMPDQIHFVFLSATIPNAKEFAQWITDVHSQPCHVVYTDYRPTPLQHYLFPAGGEGLYLVVDSEYKFREDNFQKAISLLGVGDDTDALGLNDKKTVARPKKGPGMNDDLERLLTLVTEKDYTPVIVFSFSKREVESNAQALSKLNLSTPEESQAISVVFNNAISALAEADRDLEQIKKVLPLLRRGIGIHHSGLLPIVKEVIELLFQDNLIKILFATETFSIGLNMPARTVIFTSCRKFDGKESRWVSGGEYIQMSGRAGRRGIDDKGTVIMMIDEKMEPEVAKDMVKGKSDSLDSAFRLSYNMILNLMRIEAMPAEVMLEKSFHQFQAKKSLPGLSREVAKIEKEVEHLTGSIPAEHVDIVEHFWSLRHQIATTKAELRDVFQKPSYILPYMTPGRLVRIETFGEGAKDFGWGIVCSFTRIAAGAKDDEAESYTMDVALHVTADTANGPVAGLRPHPITKPGGVVVVIPTTLTSVSAVTQVRLTLPDDMNAKDGREKALRFLQQVAKRFAAGPPLLDLVKDMKITEPSVPKWLKQLETLEDTLQKHPFSQAPMSEAQAAWVGALEQRERLIGDKRKLLQSIKDAQKVMQLDELKGRIRVLRKLQFTSPTGEAVIELKGRVACEISSGDELLLTEMMFQGMFQNLDAVGIVALLSCFVYSERASSKSKELHLPESVMTAFKAMQVLARKIARVAKECRLDIDENDYVDKFRPELMPVAKAWAEGKTFSEVCKLTAIYEGSIVRCLRRLEELLRQMVLAAKAIGNPDLEVKFAEGITLIKRDIIFAASLYL